MRKLGIVLGCGAFFVALIVVLLHTQNMGTGSSPLHPVRSEPDNLRIAPASGSSHDLAQDFILQRVKELHASQGRADARASVVRLAEYFRTLSPSNAVAEILQVLDRGVDAPTHLGFKLASNGALEEAPTVRTLLLGLLIQLDPAAAAAYAEKILSRMDSADEWAVALRAYALADTSPGGQTFLRQKFRELISNENWRNDPSAGFLEAFDVAVYTRDQALAPEMAGLLQQKSNPVLAHAAYLALDRLVQVEPVAVLGQLAAQPSLMEGREGTRADYFARADVRDLQQRAILEQYLLDPSRPASELQKFTETYPNANYMVSHNLLTRSSTPMGQEIAARTRETLVVVNAWLTDPRFEKIKPQLERVKDRLRQLAISP